MTRTTGRKRQAARRLPRPRQLHCATPLPGLGAWWPCKRAYRLCMLCENRQEDARLCALSRKQGDYELQWLHVGPPAASQASALTMLSTSDAACSGAWTQDSADLR